MDKETSRGYFIENTDSIEYKCDKILELYPNDLTIKIEIDEIRKHIDKLKDYISNEPKVEVINDIELPSVPMGFF